MQCRTAYWYQLLTLLGFVGSVLSVFDTAEYSSKAPVAFCMSVRYAVVACTIWLSLPGSFACSSRVLVVNQVFIQLGNPLESPPPQHPSVSSTSLRPHALQGTGRAASGGALAPEPPRATGVGPEFPRVFFAVFHLFRGSCVFSGQFSRYF